MCPTFASNAGVLAGDVRPSVCDSCPILLGLQSVEVFDELPASERLCHADDMEGIQPPGICRSLALAKGWITN